MSPHLGAYTDLATAVTADLTATACAAILAVFRRLQHRPRLVDVVGGSLLVLAAGRHLVAG